MRKAELAVPSGLIRGKLNNVGVSECKTNNNSFKRREREEAEEGKMKFRLFRNVYTLGVHVKRMSNV